MAILNTGLILFGGKGIVLYMSVMALPGAAVVKEWRLVKDSHSIISLHFTIVIVDPKLVVL